jgi:hypothetical protein
MTVNSIDDVAVPGPQAQPGQLARQLAYAGLLPYVGAALFLWLLINRVDHEQVLFVATALTQYAALSAVFAGALPWGLTMRVGRDRHDSPPARRALWWGTACLSVAWVATLMPPHAALVVLGVLLIGSYLSDRALYTLLHAQGWLQLRFRLTVVASLSCFLAAAQL